MFQPKIDPTSQTGSHGRADRPASSLAPALAFFLLAAGQANCSAQAPSPTPSGPPVEVSPSDPNIRYIGRWDRSNPAIVMLRTLGGPYENEILQAYEDLHQNDANLHHVDTTGWLVREDYSDGVHPSSAGHMKLARLLANSIEPILNEHNP